MAALIIDGNAVSEKIRRELSADIAALKKDTGVVPGLAVVLVGDNPASMTYVRNKNKAAHKIGIHSEQHSLPATSKTPSSTPSIPTRTPTGSPP
jgi:methylenetetrahydrofolate dehydrogenase (NADP+)/methenyltetrahydrofolate cyclohydrolase